MPFYEYTISVRITDKTKRLIDKLLNDYPEDYDSPSHLIRASIIREFKRRTEKPAEVEAQYKKGRRHETIKPK